MSQDFTDFLETNDIVHRRTTPLWPQANGEVERQNRHLLKAMKIAKANGQDIQRALNVYQMAYRTTPHSTTGVSPGRLMYGRSIRCKLPELGETTRVDQELRDTDSERKQKCKDYADTRRNAKESDLEPGDQVLLQQRKRDKLTTTFEPEPYGIVQRYGNQVTVESPDGVQYKRNMSQVKRYLQPEPDRNIIADDINETAVSEEALEDPGGGSSVTQPDTTPAHADRPRRECSRPARFQDFVMS